MKRWLTVMSLAMAVLLQGQKIETQKGDRSQIMRLETAMNHLTVIEVGEAVEQVAAGSASYKVEWRGNKVFVQPLEPDAATNLFIWTETGNRLSYELTPAASVATMHFAIDPEPVAIAEKVQPVPPAAAPPIPAEMLYKSVPVKFAGEDRHKQGVTVLLRDLYRKDGKLYLRYAIRNAGTALYEPGDPAVMRLAYPRSARSLYAMSRTQVGENFRITAKAQEQVPLLHSEVEAPVVAPGEETVGLLAVELPHSQTPTVLRFQFPADQNREVVATLVL